MTHDQTNNTTDETEEARTARIRELNDRFRTGAGGAGQVLITAGIEGLGPDKARAVYEAVQRFDDFTADNDPYGEHDFGAFDLDGRKIFWKIDTYDLSMTMMSPDPADPAVTRRVLTIMLASEY